MHLVFVKQVRGNSEASASQVEPACGSGGAIHGLVRQRIARATQSPLLRHL